MSPLKFKALLLLSIVAFLGGTIMSASSDDSVKADEKAAEHSDTTTSEQSAPTVDPQSGCLADPTVLEDIRAQKAKIADMQKALDEREAELAKREQAVVEEVKKIETAREAIEKIEDSKKELNDEKVAKLVETYETMSPKSAAKVLAELDERLAVATITRMDTAKLSKIMNLMEPQKSARLTELLAGVGKAKTATIPNLGNPAQGSKPVASQSVKGGDKNDGQQNNSKSSKSGDISGNEGQSGPRPASAGPQG